ncbi:MAG: hypothetical protein M0R21_08810 [Lentimicrobiaceae bacterium]|nr:hypothetical protein [Lentimicrobiaceae bacterium]
MNIITESSFWLIVFCLLAGFVFTFILYFKNKKNDFPPRLLRILAILRFVSVTFIAFLLLSPMLMAVIRRVEKPIIIIAQDNSHSLLLSVDSAFYRTAYTKKIDSLAQQLASKYDVKRYTFGNSISANNTPDFSEKQTDISQLFDELLTRYANRNVGAVVIASDGIYNKGKNPVYASDVFQYPVFTIAMGDTIPPKDVLISRVDYNRISFLGNTFSIEVTITSAKCKGSQVQLTIKRGKEILSSQNLNINTDTYQQTFTLQLKADKPGLQHYHISISPTLGEISKDNNFLDIFIEVIDSKQKILLLYNSPHPDIGSIKKALESNMNYTVDVLRVNELNQALSKYNLIVLHQLPSVFQHTSALFRQISQQNIPVLYIVGAQTDISGFNQQNNVTKILAAKTNFNEALPVFNPHFPFFTIENDLKQLIENSPPLICPYGDYKTSNASVALFYQKIGSVATEKPLILFNNKMGNKTGIIAGEGIWKWRINDYVKNNSHLLFDGFISKIMQYLTVKEDKGFFRVNGDNKYFENEQVEFSAEVYNNSYELITTPEVSIEIMDSSGKKYPYTFSKTSQAYYLNAGSFPPGNYTFRSQVKLNNRIETKTGTFVVVPLNIESINTVANHNMLYTLAKNHQGKMFYPSEITKLCETLRNREDIKNISFLHKKYVNFNNIFLILLLILTLLSTEWYLRKRAGSY